MSDEPYGTTSNRLCLLAGTGLLEDGSRRLAESQPIVLETEGQGAFSPEEIEGLVQRDGSGKVIALGLPKKTVLIANHQVRELMC